MRKKSKNKYSIGGSDPIIDARSKAAKMAWDTSPTTYAHPSVMAGSTPTSSTYMYGTTRQDAPSFLPNQIMSETEEFSTGVYNLHPAFQAVNTLALAATTVGQSINEGRRSKLERRKYNESLQSVVRDNNPVLNDLPMYYEKGGRVKAQNGQNVMKIADNAPRHEQGGVDLSPQVEAEAGEAFSTIGNEVDRVLENTSTHRKDKDSKLLKITPTRFEELFGFKTKKTLSHADALEEAEKKYSVKRKKIEKGLDKSADTLIENKNDVYASNSIDLNLKTVQTIPTKDDVFDLLFDHQETIKNMVGMTNEKAKYGGKYIAKTGYEEAPIDPHKGDKNATKNPKTKQKGKDWNKSKYSHAQWLEIQKKLGYTGEDDNKVFQAWLAEKHPTLVDKYHSEDEYGMPAVTKKKIDGYLGVRWDAIVDELLAPKTTPAPAPAPAAPAGTPQEPQVEEATPQDKFNFVNNGIKASVFNEPLRWYDTAGPLMALASADRAPANYNPVELNPVRLKLQNPTPALEAGQRDANAAYNLLPNSGAGMANATQVFSNKYAVDNQVLAQYEAANVGIRNQEEMYNANVYDRQSAANQASRDLFEKQMLAGKEAQRQQKLKAFDDMFTRIALNRKLNREGNLLMQLAPQYDQYGKYNGNQRVFRGNAIGAAGNTAGVQYITDPISGRQYRVINGADGKPIPSSKFIPDNRAVGSDQSRRGR